jgi:hypothetical protein
MLGFGSKTCLLGGDKMSRKRYSPEQIICYLREAEVLLSKGSRVPEVCRKIGIVEQTYYRWRKKYVSLSVGQAFEILFFFSIFRIKSSNRTFIQIALP